MGILFIGLFIWNTWKLMKTHEGRRNTRRGTEEATPIRIHVTCCIVRVIACNFYIVESDTSIALSLGVPKVVIGATIVALGTSLPELATSLEATKRNSINLALANIVGSGFLNVTLILGVTLVAANLTANIAAFTNIAVFSLIANLFLWYFLSSDRVYWQEGAVLIGLYLLFLYTSLRF